MENNKRFAVLGSGSWATAIVKILLNNCNKVNWWVREPEVMENLMLYHHNPIYLSSVEFDIERLNISNDINEIIEVSDVIIFCIPSAFLHQSLSPLKRDSLKGKLILSAIKGIVPEYNKIVAEYFNTKFEISFENIGIISGPSHAEEVALEKLTYLTVASQNQDFAEFIVSKINCRYIFASVSDDIFGTEYSAVLKNVVAIANGICIALGYGDNFQAVLISNAIQEIKRFVDEVHPINRDINSSVYLGDLLVTSYSQFSRNRTFGNMIGKGYSVKFAQLEMKMIAEGYYAVKCIKEINDEHGVDMPITTAVYNILYAGFSPENEIKRLTKKLS